MSAGQNICEATVTAVRLRVMSPPASNVVSRLCSSWKTCFLMALCIKARIMEKPPNPRSIRRADSCFSKTGTGLKSIVRVMSSIGFFYLLVLVCAAPIVTMGNNISKNCPLVLDTLSETLQPNAVLNKHESALLILLGFGGFSFIISLVHNAIRKHVYHDEHNLDTAFDAGGDVSSSLTAVTVAAQILWPADIIQSATLAVKLGVFGTFWFAGGVLLNIFMFPIFSVYFKTRAPGAKTYLQVIHARFGMKAHIVFCCFSLLTNLVSLSVLVLVAKATIQTLTENASDEYTLLIMATLFGSYSLIGGIGTTFYVSYFNLSLVYIVMTIFFINILYTSVSDFPNLGDLSKMYNIISCVEGSMGDNLMTFRSESGMILGIVGFILASSLTYCNQASWQSRIASKPMQGVWGFILAGMMWVAIPSTMGNTAGMAYITLSAENGTHLLTERQINQGLVTPFIAEKLLGPTGGIMILSMLSMAIMSTGSGEVMAISSILVYDFYQIYIRPFRKNLPSAHCVLCGKITKSDVDSTDLCHCPSVSSCNQCSEDILPVGSPSSRRSSSYKCSVHGAYRSYQDSLINFKGWCIVWVIIAIIPFGLIVFASEVQLYWVIFFGAILTIPSFPAVVLVVLWVKQTSEGVIAGSIIGLLAGVSAALLKASMYEGGLSNFAINTSQDYSILAGTCCSFIVSLITCIIVSLLTHKIKSKTDADTEWQKLYDIDNPLSPWEQKYREELRQHVYDKRPSYDQMAATFSRAKFIAYVSGGGCIILFAIVIPGIMASFPVLGETQFKAWMILTQAWAVLMGIVATVAPPIEEFMKIRKQRRKNKARTEIKLIVCD
ncbi:uncharacterized protein [Argopecten irradians]|uniref:uncharacterized protein n=1 Tax=Argopecten irradians TaxID=31199 RepID=UPI003719CB4E